MSAPLNLNYNQTSDQSVEIEKYGDLLRNVCVRLKVTALNSTTHTTPAWNTDGSAAVTSCFCNWAPYHLFRNMKLQLGSNTIWEMTGADAALVVALESESQNQLTYAANNGSLTERRAWATKEQEWIVPLPTPYRTFPIPTTALGRSILKFVYQTEPFHKIVETSAATTVSINAVAVENYGAITASELILEFVFVTFEEQDFWRTNEHTMIIQLWKTQVETKSCSSSGETLRRDIYFSNPVAEYIIVVQEDSKLTATDGSNALNQYYITNTDAVDNHNFSTIDIKFGTSGTTWKYSSTFCKQLVPFINYGRLHSVPGLVHVPVSSTPENPFLVGTSIDTTQTTSATFELVFNKAYSNPFRIRILARTFNQFVVRQSTGVSSFVVRFASVFVFNLFSRFSSDANEDLFFGFYSVIWFRLLLILKLTGSSIRVNVKTHLIKLQLSNIFIVYRLQVHPSFVFVPFLKLLKTPHILWGC